MSFTRFRSN